MKIIRSIGRGLFVIGVPLLVLAAVIFGGAGLGFGAYWLIYKAQPSDFTNLISPPEKPDFSRPAVAKWPLCERCEPPRFQKL